MFKKLMFKMTKSVVISYALGKIKTKKFKKNFVKKINDKVDIPGLNEKQEKQIFDAVVITIAKVL